MPAFRRAIRPRAKPVMQPTPWSRGAAAELARRCQDKGRPGPGHVLTIERRRLSRFRPALQTGLAALLSESLERFDATAFRVSPDGEWSQEIRRLCDELRVRRLEVETFGWLAGPDLNGDAAR